MTLMLEGRRVRSEFERSKLYLPGENRVLVPQDWNGSSVIHAPLKPALEAFLMECRQPRWALGGGAAGAWTFTDASRTSMLNGTWDFDTDTFLTALHLSSGTQPGAGTTTWAGLSTSQHATANGYSAGGISMGALTLAGTTTVTVDDPADMVWTASGGSITARWGVLYESGGNVVAYFLLDSTPADVTATSGNTLTIALHASGIFTLA